MGHLLFLLCSSVPCIDDRAHDDDTDSDDLLLIEHRTQDQKLNERDNNRADVPEDDGRGDGDEGQSLRHAHTHDESSTT